MAFQATASRSCSEYRTTQLGPFSRIQDNPTLARSWRRYSGCGSAADWVQSGSDDVQSLQHLDAVVPGPTTQPTWLHLALVLAKGLHSGSARKVAWKWALFTFSVNDMPMYPLRLHRMLRNRLQTELKLLRLTTTFRRQLKTFLFESGN